MSDGGGGGGEAGGRRCSRRCSRPDIGGDEVGQRWDSVYMVQLCARVGADNEDSYPLNVLTQSAGLKLPHKEL